MIPCKLPLQEVFLHLNKPRHILQHLLLNNSANLLDRHHHHLGPHHLGPHHLGHHRLGHRPQILLLALRIGPPGHLRRGRHPGHLLNLQDHQDPHQVEVVE